MFNCVSPNLVLASLIFVFIEIDLRMRLQDYHTTGKFSNQNQLLHTTFSLNCAKGNLLSDQTNFTNLLCDFPDLSLSCGDNENINPRGECFIARIFEAFFWMSHSNGIDQIQ